MASGKRRNRLGEPLRVRLDPDAAEAVKAQAKVLTEETGMALGVSAAMREIIGRGLLAYRSKEQRDSFAAGVREGWRAAMREIKSKLAGAFDAGDASAGS